MMNARVAGAVIIAAIVGASAVYFWTMPGRYRIIAIRTPASALTSAMAALGKIDSNDAAIHETVMLDTASGRTWVLMDFGTTDIKHKVAGELWAPLRYLDPKAPQNAPDRTRRDPD
ncbi:MAG: hypothetical protein ACREEL_14715 [Stellaceae bacterium]